MGRINKKLIFSLTSLILVSSLAFPRYSLAKDDNDSNRGRGIGGLFNVIRDDVNNGIKGLMGARAWIAKGVVTAINGTTLTVSQNNISYTVNTDSSTIFRRKFGGKSSLSEISVNDIINVLGKWLDSAKTQIQATHIRDLSIQKRHAVFFGTVSSLNGSTFVLATVKRGNQTVTVSSSTKLWNRKMQAINLADIQTGNLVRVIGTWDQTNSTIAEVTQVKDFSLPLKSNPSPTPTP